MISIVVSSQPESILASLQLPERREQSGVEVATQNVASDRRQCHDEKQPT
jgi:hypothetical protein